MIIQFTNFEPRARHISCVRDFANRQNDMQAGKFPMVFCTRLLIAIFRIRFRNATLCENEPDHLILIFRLLLLYSFMLDKHNTGGGFILSFSLSYLRNGIRFSERPI